MTELTKAIDTYHGLDTLTKFRQSLFKTLKSLRCGAVITPFFDFWGDPIETLNRCLSSVISYMEADVYQARSRYDKALSLLSSTLQAMENGATRIGAPIHDVLQKIDKDVRSHSEQNPHLQPAQLAINADLRRYPLHEPDLDLTIPMQLINNGEGTAADVEVTWVDAIGLKDLGGPVTLQSVAPGAMIIETLARTDPLHLEKGQGALCEFGIHWVNGDGTVGEHRLTNFLKAQDTKVDWEALTRSNPYSLDAVKDPVNLVGRTRLLNRILGTLNTDAVGSLYIHGQKRVGKTSLANVALAILAKEYGMTTMFIDIGDILHPVSHRVVANLARRIMITLDQRYDLRIDRKALRDDGTLSPLIELVSEIVKTGDGKRIIIALDEFDRLPLALLQRTQEADTFFLGLRRLSNIQGIGLVLIGAERMKIVLNGPGVELNRFAGFTVDYIHRSQQWSEFKELVRSPTNTCLDFTEKACDRIYEYTQGNPYYTKQVCGAILERAVQRRDSFIDDRDVNAAVELLLADLDAISFSHYWEDFLLGDEKKRNEITIDRRLGLLAFGAAAAADGSASLDDIIQKASALGLESHKAKKVMDEFVSRNILYRRNAAVLQPRIWLFGRWIMGRGQEDIVIAQDEYESAREAITERRSYRVKLTEAEELADEWSIYNGKRVSSDHLLGYLRQFGDEYHQRLIYLLLKGVVFIGVAEEEKLLNEAYQMLEHGMGLRHGNWRRKQIAISYTGRVGKSGLAMARSFARANKFIAKTDIVRPDRLAEQSKDSITDVVVVDDFCGSGQTLCGDLQAFQTHVARGQMVHVFTLAGIDEGVEKVEERAIELFGPDGVRVRNLHVISRRPGPFGEGSKVFPTSAMAGDARTLVEQVGRKLQPKTPLGYGNGCALITFSRTIPNNAPPILWSSSSGQFRFTPLFPRH